MCNICEECPARTIRRIALTGTRFRSGEHFLLENLQNDLAVETLLRDDADADFVEFVL